jgi:predicted Zn-dependent protease
MTTLSADSHFRRGIAALNARDAARAASHFEEAIYAERLRGAIRPRARFLSYYGLSRALTNGATREAIQACELAVARDSFDPTLHLNLARVYLLAHRKSRALDVLERARRLHPGHAALEALLAKVDRRCRPVVVGLGRNHTVNKVLGRVRTGLRRRARTEWDLGRAFRKGAALS